MSAEAQTMVIAYKPFDIKHRTINVGLHVDPSIPTEKVEAAMKAITSESSFLQNSKLYFYGWQGVLDEAAKESGQLPPILKITFSGKNDITIRLTSSSSSEMYSGLTTFTERKMMLERSYVTIFDVSDISSSAVAAVTRHELGHALGLGHALTYGDLMYPEFNEEIGYISDDDKNTLKKEYWH